MNPIMIYIYSSAVLYRTFGNIIKMKNYIGLFEDISLYYCMNFLILLYKFPYIIRVNFLTLLFKFPYIVEVDAAKMPIGAGNVYSNKVRSFIFDGINFLVIF